MKILLGQELDGNVYRTLPGGRAETGTITAGTAGFLDVLELSLGFPEKKRSYLRVFQYEHALRRAMEDRAFYAPSFRADPFGAAELLLKARDEIFLSAPSSFTLDESADRRLGTFAKVEREFLSLDPEPGVPDRLRAVLSELRSGRFRTGIDEIVLIDAPDSWHVLFRELVLELERQGTALSPYVPDFPARRGDLGTVLADLVGERRGSGQGAPAGDGSFLLVRAPGTVETADFLAVLCGPLLRRGESVLLIDAGGSAEPSNAFLRRGLPAPGGEVLSSGLPLLEILPLYLSLQFAPADPDSVLRYLDLPWSPVPANLRRALKEALIEIPGTGSDGWKRALDRFGSGSRSAVPVDAWLEFGAVPSGGELSRNRMNGICDSFAEWLETLRIPFDDERDEAVSRAQLQAELYLKVSGLRGGSGLSVRALSALRRDVSRSFLESSKTAPEAGSPWLVSSPAAVLSSADTIIYWNFTEAAVPSPSRNMFLPEERKALSAEGAEFLTPESLYRSHEEAVVRALSFGRKRVLLVCPEHENGEPVNPHPLWYRMMKAFSGDAEKALCRRSASWLSASPIAASMDPGLSDAPVLEHCGRSVRFGEAVEPGVGVPPAERLSPSRLDSFLGCPLSFVLTHGAKLEPSTVELPSGGLLYGKIAHAVIETCLNADPGFEEAGSIRERLAHEASDFIRRSASVLALDGMDRERDWVIRKIADGGSALASSLSRGGYRVLGTEKSMEAESDGITIKGIADLVVERKATGEKVVIDMKWSGEDTYRELLEQGKAIQTAVYAFLTGSVRTAYFIVSKGRFVTVHPGLFPDAEVVTGPDEESVWNLARTFIGGRAAALGEGRVETGHPDRRWKSGLDEGERKFFREAPCRFCNHVRFCGTGAI